MLRDAEGRLAACEARAASALREVLAKSAGPDARPDGVAAERRRRQALRRPPAAARVGRAPQPARAIPRSPPCSCTRRPSRRTVRPEVIAGLYNLTPSELRVLLAIVEVGGVAETARALGVAEATVKTHLHRLFGKTGASRQADLVKLVAGFSNPLVGGSRPPPPPGQGRRLMDGVASHP